MLHKKSMRDTAYELMLKKKKPIAFDKLWNEVSELLGLEANEKSENISEFYTQMILDGRFIFLEENTWDLKSRHAYEKISIDMNDIYADIEDEIEEVENETFKEDSPDDLDPDFEKPDVIEEEVGLIIEEDEEEEY